MSNSQFDLSAYLTDLEYLVNIDSGSHHPEGITLVASFFCERFSQLGWDVKLHNYGLAAGPCLEIVNNSDAQQYDVLLMGHMDTVFKVGTATERPFTIKEGKAFGPGVIDMKSGLLSIYYVLHQMHVTGALKGISVCVALNSDEEISSKYSRPWLEELSRKSKRALVMEPARADGNLVNRRKGIGRYTLEFKGLASHAGVDPEKGCSAIQELAHWVLALHGMTNYQTGTTVNVGVISGGTNANVVADSAKAEVDVRICDLAEAIKIEELMRELTNNPRAQGVTAKVSGGVTRPPMNPSDETLKLCSILEQIGSNIGINIGWTFTGGGSDGCFSANLGVPTIDGLGPVGGGAHGPGEYLVISSVEPRFHLVKRLIQHIAEDKQK